MEINKQKVSQDNNQQQTQEEAKPPSWIITEHQELFLRQLRESLIHQRAYEALNMSGETMFEAAQATGFSLGRLKMLDELLECSKTVHPM